MGTLWNSKKRRGTQQYWRALNVSSSAFVISQPVLCCPLQKNVVCLFIYNCCFMNYITHIHLNILKVLILHLILLS